MADTKKDTVEKFKFEPIKGYPMLNWRGKRPFTMTQYYPAQLKESYGTQDNSGWFNKIFWGDNLQVMSHLLKDYRGKLDLIYIDPPFDSKANYKKMIEIKGDKIFNDQNSFEEKQYTDIWNNDEYLQFMYERLVLIKELLSERGSLYLHCDWHKAHHLRCLCDEIFGSGVAGGDNLAGFRNQIAWCYSGGGTPKNEMPRKHDILLWYSKTNEWIFNTQYRPYSEGTLQRGRTAVKGENAQLREEGTPINDWWTDIKKITSPTDPEKLYYPTQKSEELLERIIKMHTNNDSIVFDCFMGSGTTQAVAHKLGRRYLGSDINQGAIRTTIKRLLNLSNLSLQVYNVNNYDVFRNPVEAKELLKEALSITSLNSSIYDGEKDGRLVKIMPINRIATKADLNELITGFDLKAFKKRKEENPNKPVEKILLVCMGHEADLKASLELAAKEMQFTLDVEVVDILRDKTDIQFKRDSEAKVSIKKGKLVIDKFYPMNLLQKLSLQKSKVENWKELVESVVIDWNYDGAVLSPAIVDAPEKSIRVLGEYDVPKDAGTIRVKITDLLSESLEVEVSNG